MNNTLGNTLTVIALPYARWKHPELTILSYPSVDLMINLSVCELLYCVIGISHFVHVLSVGECLPAHHKPCPGGYPYQGWKYGEQLCYWQAAIRHVVFIAQFFTMGAIAISICCRQLISTPRYSAPVTGLSQNQSLSKTASFISVKPTEV